MMKQLAFFTVSSRKEEKKNNAGIAYQHECEPR